MNLDFLRLYRSLFHWREDLYAYHREKEEKSGYYPAYQFDRNTFRKHQANDGNLANFEEKTLAPLTDSVIIRHLKGKWFRNLIEILLQWKSLQKGSFFLIRNSWFWLTNIFLYDKKASNISEFYSCIWNIKKESLRWQEMTAKIWEKKKINLIQKGDF